MSRFYTPKEFFKGNLIRIEGKEAHHILRVMRLKKSDKVVTFDGEGKDYSGFIKDIGPKSLVVEITKMVPHVHTNKARMTLLQSIPKKEKMDYIVEKAVELGVSSIIPVLTGRTVPDWDDAKKARRLERWRKIAIESSKQCGNPDVPEIPGVKDFAEAVSSIDGYGLKLIAALSDEAIRLKEALSGFKGGRIAVFIGPEGDFTASELETAMEAGFTLVDLGQNVLKSDTAGLFVLSILSYEFSK